MSPRGTYRGIPHRGGIRPAPSTTYRVTGAAMRVGDRIDDAHLPFCTVVTVEQITDGWLITTDLTGAWHTIVIGPDEHLRVVA